MTTETRTQEVVVQPREDGRSAGRDTGARPRTRPVLRNQDISLLPVLRALLLERSVTRAGEVVGLSQPATSAALARLRRRFGDDLLVRVGRAYELTPFAATLLVRLETATEALDRLFGEQFDPDTTTRQFSIASSDYAVAVLAEAVNQVLASESHGRPSIDLRHLSTTDMADVEALIRRNDAVIMPREAIRGYPSIPLVEDRLVCVVAESNDAVGESVTTAHLGTLPMVITYGGRDPLHHAPLRGMRRLGIEPSVAVNCENFLTVPFLVAHSSRLAFLHESLAHRMAQILPIRVLDSPIDLGALTLHMWWHPTLDDDPAHVWFRRLMTVAARRLREHGHGPTPEGQP